MNRITIKDVAKASGFSITTVSHVVNNTRFVEPATKNAVRRCIEELGYQPNSVARSLRKGTTHTIGLIVPDASNMFFAEIARRIEDFGFEAGYSVILGNSDNDQKKQESYIRTLLSKRVDGFLFISSGDDEDLLRIIQSHGVPVVAVDRDVKPSLADVGMLDNELAGYLAANHLIQRGHRNIACITGPNNLAPSQLRLRGYLRALDEANIRRGDEVVRTGDFTIAGGRDQMKALLNHHPGFDAVFVCNDMMALGAISVLHSRGIKVPADVAIIGCDDIELARMSNPPISTIAQPIGAMAEWATQQLILRINQEHEGEKVRKIFAPELVIRESTGGAHG